MARLIDESFEGTGYEESWTEGLSTATADEDSTGPGTMPLNAGTQCLKITRPTGAGDNHVYQSFSPSNTVWCRAYVYIESEALSSGQSFDVIVALFTSSIGETVGGAKLSKTAGGQLQLVFNYNNGSWVDLGTANISTGQWYCVEYHQNTTTGAVQAWVDGVSVGSVTGESLPRGNAQHISIGPRWSGSNGVTAALTMYADLVVVDNAQRVGPESSGEPDGNPSTVERYGSLRMGAA